MSLFCLVHGSTQSATGWDLLVRELSARGHQSVLADLPTDTPDSSATVYARAIADTIPAGTNDAIVVAHSASGMFLPLVPGYCKIGRMVFLAAVVPQVGASVLDQVKADPNMLSPEWIGKNPTNDEVAMEFLFHDCSPDVAQWALTTRRLLIAKQAMIEICPLPSWPSVPSSYIVCADDRTIQPQWSRRVARERLGVEALELPGGHCPHVSRPTELADMLTRLAG